MVSGHAARSPIRRLNLFRCRGDGWTSRARAARKSRWQAYYLEKPMANSSAEAMKIVRAAKDAAEGGRRPGQGLSAGLPQAPQGARLWLPRPHPVGAAGSRLVGVRRRALSGAALELELSQGGRRRTRARYVSALALSTFESDRTDQGCIVPQDNAAAKAPGREGKAF